MPTCLRSVAFLSSVAASDVLQDVLTKGVHVTTLPGPHSEVFGRLEEIASDAPGFARTLFSPRCLLNVYDQCDSHIKFKSNFKVKF